MKRERSSIWKRRSLAVACAGVAASTCTSATTQQDPAAESRGIIKVQVTGTNIPRSDVETALPVQVISREEIERSGSTTVAELMAKVSANLLPFNDALSVDNVFNAGLASVNLRGLGDGSTLVLLNGRRVSNYAFSGAALDVNQIPLSAVDRIEILKDGASAIYGSDAMAGVVNFILRRNFAGAEVSGLGSWTEAGGGDQRQGNVTAGHGELSKDGYNVFLTASFQKDKLLHATQRSFSSTGYRPDEGLLALPNTTYPANFFAAGRLFNPSYANGCAPPDSLPSTGAFTRGDACGYDIARSTTLLPEVERSAAYGRGTLRIGAAHEVFAELAYSDNRLIATRSPTPVAPFDTPEFTIFVYPAGGPFYPTSFAEANGISGDLPVFYRTVPLGPRVTETKSTAWRAVAGANGTVDRWDYATGLSYSRNEARNAFTSGYVALRRFQEAMATGLINPFGPSGAEGEALLSGAQFIGEANTATGTTIGFDAKASTELYRMPNGPLAVAMGVEARREELEYRFADALTSGDILGFDFATKPIAGDRSVQALFGELGIPLASGVEAQIAARYDHYSDFGGTINPKVALRWQPFRRLLLRASWGTGFRAPTLYDLFEPQLRTTLVFFEDPIRCPVTGADRDCVLQSAVLGGNPNLQPEKSTQVNAGAVWVPLPDLTLAIDYWNIGKRGFISQLDLGVLADNFAYFESTNILRGPVDPAYPGLPGPIDTVVLTWQNLGKVNTSGVDVNVQWKSQLTPLGRLAFSLDGTYVIDWRWQPDGINYESAVGKHVIGPLPRWRHTLAFDWDAGIWGVTLGQRYMSGYEDVNFFPPRLSPPPEPRRVSSYEVWDFQARYTGLRNWSIAAGIKNLLDRDPPRSNQPFSSQLGYDPTYADPRGRTYYARVTYAFK